MKTDLTKILSISGQPGLYLYIAQARSGAIVESLSDKKRSCFGLTSKMTTLADISIYTTEGEMKLSEVFLKLKDVLGGAEAPASKASSDELKALFAKAVPDYDGERFYVSHMKKVVDWYNCLLKYASLDFVTPEEEASESEEK
ncbi:MAG: DUF5606 domain-containing protein [Candidatus Cryptobacteroides sp.]|nr:DUF5606 domain-containing protein [Bacteroidales bacterium]MDD7134181.1 DUF5606 domain-containing protein [Bacteroidales bacterium]MDY2773585.1 DUF5606 domain-containing protein [Candidatus Cryptobacteroides sp.]